MDLRRSLLTNAGLQLLLILCVVVLANVFVSRHFTRVDLTADHLYSLDATTRGLLGRLERPLVAKVYFTRGLEAPYNNHEQILIDKLEDMRAYSKGWMDIQVQDPTGRKDLEEEAARFGIAPIRYVYKSASRSELKQVYMGVALVYGDRQEVLAQVSSTETLEYELAGALKNLVATEDRKVIGFAYGHGEPDVLRAAGPLQTLSNTLREHYNVAMVPLGGKGLLPEEVDALLVVGPQEPYSQRALYQLDQFLMRGGALGFFVTNVKPDLRSYRAQGVIHGLEPLLGFYGVQLNRDVVVDRKENGRFPFPIAQQGGQPVRRSINYPLIPKATILKQDSAVLKGMDSLLFPFASSLTLADPLPPDIQADVLAASSGESGRIRGVRTIDPFAYQTLAQGEELGSAPLMVSLTGTWRSFYANKDAPPAPADAPDDPAAAPDDPAARLRESVPTRLVVAGSGDFVGNNVPVMLNLVDWMVQDEDLIAIRSKVVKLPEIRAVTPEEAIWIKALNLLGGTVALLMVGGLRWLARRRGGAA